MNENKQEPIIELEKGKIYEQTSPEEDIKWQINT